jgi:hypothetical protein
VPRRARWMGGARLCAAPRGRREWGWAPADDHKWREVGTGPQAAGTSDDVMRGSRGRRGGSGTVLAHGSAHSEDSRTTQYAQCGF